MSVTLKNTSKRMRTFHLPLSCDSEGLRRTVIVQNRILMGKDGKERYRPKKMFMPPVLTLLPGEVVSGLPDQVLHSKDLKKALNDPKDGLRLMKIEPDSKPAPAKASAPAPAPAEKSAGSASGSKRTSPTTAAKSEE